VFIGKNFKGIYCLLLLFGQCMFCQLLIYSVSYFYLFLFQTETKRLSQYVEIHPKIFVWRQFEEHSTTFPSFASLVEKVLAAQKTNHSSSVFNTETSSEHVPSTSASTNPSASSLQNEYWKQELRSLKHMSLCKKCFRSKASVVLLPCGHLALCSDCARESSLCPLCNGIIQETIHSYLV